MLDELGALLRQARVAAGVSWPELEALVGPRSSLGSIETGKVRTRASRLRPWLERLGVDPDPVLERFAAVIAPESEDGRPRFKPVTPRTEPPGPRPRRLEPPPLEAHAQATLGAELWRIRVDAGLGRPELAAAIGCSRITVFLVERGLRRPTLDLVEAWVAAAGAVPASRALLALRFPGWIAPPSVAGRWRGAPKSTRPRTHGPGPATEETRP